MLRWLTAGESHGPLLVGMLEGLPAGVVITTEQVQAALVRRRLGHGRGARMAFEQDEVRLVGGVRHGLTQGGPVAIEVGNTEWPKWQTVMSADPVPADLLAAQARNAPLTRPRPGHADLVGMQKYGFEDARPVLERASARETAARVALGAVASAFLQQAAGIRLVSHTVDIGAVATPPQADLPGPDDVAALDADPVRCWHRATSAAMVAEIDDCRRTGDTVGGVVEVLAYGLPAGARQPRALGPPPRCPARRSPDGGAGHQGRRGGRRLHHRPSSRLGGPRRDRARRRRAAATSYRAGRRHRGWHVDR